MRERHLVLINHLQNSEKKIFFHNLSYCKSILNFFFSYFDLKTMHLYYDIIIYHFIYKDECIFISSIKKEEIEQR